jgi:hypothetical protein
MLAAFQVFLLEYLRLRILHGIPNVKPFLSLFSVF